MIGIIVYLLGCFAVAVVLTFLYVMMRPIHTRDELKSWKILAVFYILCLSGPYAYDEVITHLAGNKMLSAVNAAVDASNVGGDLQYYKVVSYSGHKARVIAVTSGKADWGGTDKPVVAMTLDKQGDDWELESYLIVRSFHSGEDGWTFPPYF